MSHSLQSHSILHVPLITVTPWHYPCPTHYSHITVFSISHSLQSHNSILHVPLIAVTPRHSPCPTHCSHTSSPSMSHSLVTPMHPPCHTHYSPTQATHEAPFMLQLITVTLRQHTMDPKCQTLNVSAHYSRSPNTCWFVKADRMEEVNT